MGEFFMVRVDNYNQLNFHCHSTKFYMHLYMNVLPNELNNAAFAIKFKTMNLRKFCPLKYTP